jgi:peptidoglycan/xylan/chitin deacetylase (PgdA/CDA1 family)
MCRPLLLAAGLWLTLGAAAAEPDSCAPSELLEVCAPPRVLLHGPRDVPRVALTFDACPGPPSRGVGYDERILEVLESHGVRATFFVSGAWAAAHPAALRALAASPNVELANHSWSHHRMPRERDDAQLARELLSTQELLHEATGTWPAWFRAPYVELDGRVAAMAQRAGMTAVQLDLASGDPDPRASEERLVRQVLDRARAGSIVVMHANHRKFATAKALPRIIRGLRARGLEPVTVSELLSPPACYPDLAGFQKMTSVTSSRAKPGRRPTSR